MQYDCFANAYRTCFNRLHAQSPTKLVIIPSGSCTVQVEDPITTVLVNGRKKEAGKYNLYEGDILETVCDAAANKTLPSGTNSTYVCG